MSTSLPSFFVLRRIFLLVVTTYASEMEKEKVRYANRLNERAGEHRRKHNSSPSDIYIYISSDSTNYIVSRFTKSAHGYVHSFNGFQYMNSVPQWIINTPFSEQKSCVVTYGPIQTFNHLKRERDPRAHKEKKKRAPTRRLPSGERFTASAFNARVCVCVCVFVRRGRENRLVGWLVSFFF